MNSKLIISALLSLMAVQVSQLEPPAAAQSTNKTSQASNIKIIPAHLQAIASAKTVAGTHIEVKVNTEGNNELSWTTQEPSKRESFLIQRSENGKNFRTIGRRSPEEKTFSYSFEDTGYHKDAFYRIIEVAVDGNISYSKAVRNR